MTKDLYSWFKTWTKATIEEKGGVLLGVSHPAPNSGSEGCDGSGRGHLWGDSIPQSDGRRERGMEVGARPGSLSYIYRGLFLLALS